MCDEGIENEWRRRMWPSLSSFFKALLRCNPPDIQPDKTDQKGLSNKFYSLRPCWTNDDLHYVPDSFTRANDHARTFFPLLLEECRESMLGSSPEIDFSMNTDTYYKKWRCGEVVNINYNVEGRAAGKAHFGNNLESWSKCREDSGSLGNLTILNVSIQATRGDSNTTENPFIPGDMLVLHNPLWPRSALGIVQGWDPDNVIQGYDPQGGNGNGQTDGSQSSPLNIIVCLDEKRDAPSTTPVAAPPSQLVTGGVGVGNIGGWLAADSIHPGVLLSIFPIGNVNTSARECQALSSLPYIHRELQNVIIAPSRPHHTPSVCESSVRSPSRPVSVSAELWTALEKQFNTSQLTAIAAVCATPPLVSPQPASRPGELLGAGSTGKSAVSESAEGGTVAGNSYSPITLLQGPPGTGKTRTILAIISVILAGGLPSNKKISGVKIQIGASLGTTSRSVGKRPADPRRSHVDSRATAPQQKIRVLLCAPSNTAVDELVLRLLGQGVLGRDGRRIEDLQVVRIGRAGGQRSFKTCGPSNLQSASESELLDAVDRVSLDRLVDANRLKAQTQLSNINQNFSFIRARMQLLEDADVICCTLSGAGSPQLLEGMARIPGFRFDAVVIDEAAQAVEPSALIPIKFNPQAVVLVGDPHQLPATVCSRLAKDRGYARSLFQRLHMCGHPKLMLDTQYRMHPTIALYPSLRFYGGELKTDPSVTATGTHLRLFHRDTSGRFGPMVFHDLAEGRERTEGTSICNDAEASYIVNLFKEWKEKYSDIAGKSVIGVIAPYQAQRLLLRDKFRALFRQSEGGFRSPPGGHRNMSGSGGLPWNLEIATVDGFQGREKDIVIFSCVRAPVVGSTTFLRKGLDEGVGTSIGFLREPERLNVAITRAKNSLWIVGHAETLSRGDEEWRQLVEFTRANRLLKAVSTPQRSCQPQGAQAQNKTNFQPKKLPKNTNNYHHSRSAIVVAPSSQNESGASPATAENAKPNNGQNGYLGIRSVIGTENTMRKRKRNVSDHNVQSTQRGPSLNPSQYNDSNNYPTPNPRTYPIVAQPGLQPTRVEIKQEMSTSKTYNLLRTGNGTLAEPSSYAQNWQSNVGQQILCNAPPHAILHQSLPSTEESSIVRADYNPPPPLPFQGLPFRPVQAAPPSDQLSRGQLTPFQPIAPPPLSPPPLPAPANTMARRPVLRPPPRPLPDQLPFVAVKYESEGYCSVVKPES